MKRILVIGGGFAGLWSAAGAARKLDELGVATDEVDITLVNRDPYHSIRVRNYEPDLSDVRVPLDEVLGPIGVQLIVGDVEHIDLRLRRVLVVAADGTRALPYDRLVFALGSRLVRPDIPGLAEHTFDVDTYDAGARLNAHITALPASPDTPGRYTVMIVGAGLTGIEAATEMPGKLATVLKRSAGTHPYRVILADQNPFVGSDMGDSARPVIEEALTALGIETRVGVSIARFDKSGVSLSSGEMIPAATVVWCGGMRAHPLTAVFPVTRDRSGRVPVDDFLRVNGVPSVFAAGDVARAMLDAEHASVMSCQHGRPMGRYAGHNVVADLLGLAMLPLRIDWYVTVLDLGQWGAVHTLGWDRQVGSSGQAAKATKQLINCERIYPPRSKDRREILAAAAPVVQAPPERLNESRVGTIGPARSRWNSGAPGATRGVN